MYKWTINASGWTTMEYEYAWKVISLLPESVSITRRIMCCRQDGWAKALFVNGKTVLQGTPVNVWQNIYNNTHTGYSPVVYPEFKGYYGEVTWMELSTVEGKFYIASRDRVCLYDCLIFMR